MRAVHCIRTARVSLVGALGYHIVTWRIGGEHGEAMAIAAPTRAYGSPGRRRKRWGVFAPVYSLAAPSSGQAGDLGTLRQLFEAVERRGGTYVATLPLLAAFLDEPCSFSPYSPASRLFWNELMLDLPRFAAALEMTVAAPPPIVPGTLIDYRAQYAWRRPIIDALATTFLAEPSRVAGLAAWAEERGVYDYAAFRAIGEVQRTSWRNWPTELRDGTKRARTRDDAIAMGAEPARVDSHAFAQWAMQSQLEALRGGKVSLYLDLPVGVSLDAYEVWRWRRLFLTDLAAGAPPDALFLGGQNWGLPPMSPIALRRGRYRYFIDCVRRHMRSAGMLRIDHVMGLFRLYCVPAGRPATDGVYLRYPADELLAIITLESRRGSCAVAGEDLGTVPDHVRPAMAKHGLYRLHVGQWHLPRELGGEVRTSSAARDAIASLNSNDTPTFAGWWRGADIDDKRDLGLVTPDAERAERVERDRMRGALLAFAGPSRANLTELERAMVAATADLAAGPAEIVLIALDDLALDPVPAQRTWHHGRTSPTGSDAPWTGPRRSTKPAVRRRPWQRSPRRSRPAAMHARLGGMKAIAIALLVAAGAHSVAADDERPPRIEVEVGKTIERDVGPSRGLLCDDLSIMKVDLVTRGDTNYLVVTGEKIGATQCRVGTERYKPGRVYDVFVVAPKKAP